jgi:hypothetical protein
LSEVPHAVKTFKTHFYFSPPFNCHHHSRHRHHIISLNYYYTKRENLFALSAELGEVEENSLLSLLNFHFACGVYDTAQQEKRGSETK